MIAGVGNYVTLIMQIVGNCLTVDTPGRLHQRYCPVSGELVSVVSELGRFARCLKRGGSAKLSAGAGEGAAAGGRGAVRRTC